MQDSLVEQTLDEVLGRVWHLIPMLAFKGHLFCKNSPPNLT